MADVFLSYAREDRPTAERLAHALGRHGWSVWWDRHVPAGKRFDEVIAENLASARCVVVLWSKAANASEWVAEEAEEARERGLLIPALIEAVEPPLGFRRIQAADLVGWAGEDAHSGLQGLVADIRNLARASPTAATHGVPAPAGEAASASSRRRLRLGLATAIGGLAVVLITVGLSHLAGEAPMPPTPASSWIDGRWHGHVVYGWDAQFAETFDFRIVAGALTGSAGFLGMGRAIEDGVADAESVRFLVRWNETDGSREREAVNRYVGARGGDELSMTLTITGGVVPHEPVRFTLKRAED